MKAAQTWQVDSATCVSVSQGLWGKNRVLINGAEVAAKTPFGKTQLPFTLPDGRAAELTIIPSGFRPSRELRVQGQLLLSDQDLKALVCAKCAARARAGDKFCEACGAALPGPEVQLRMAKLREARGAILVLAGMFLLFGAVMFFVQKNTSQTALRTLAQYKSTDYYPQPIQGRQVTIGELRDAYEGAASHILLTNVVLALIMLALSFYARKAPLPAIMIATGIYVAIQLLNAVADPRTISQGIVLKVIMISVLIKGLRAALELRKMTASV